MCPFLGGSACVTIFSIYFNAGILVTLYTSFSIPEEGEQSTDQVSLKDDGNELAMNTSYWVKPKKSPQPPSQEIPTPSIMETTIRPFLNTYP